MARLFTYEEASALLPEARERVARIGELVERVREVRASGVADLDAEHELDAHVHWFEHHGIQIKGVAPALLDFPAQAAIRGRAVEVLLCWREDEDAIAWYHPAETGYVGREPIAQLDQV